MALPPLSTEQLTIILESTPSAPVLYDVLSKYEPEACFLSTDDTRNENADLLGYFYSSFFITNLLVDQM